MLEINPLVITKNGHIICLDAKAVVDNNALFRQPIITNYLHENLKTIKDFFYKKALINNLNYIPMNGNIACMANGAGLAMSTMDLIHKEGGKIGAFIDIGGGTSEKKIIMIFNLLLSNKKTNVIVINIFGGILSCLKISKNLLKALQNRNNLSYIFIRLNGKDAEESKRILSSNITNIFLEDDLIQLVKLAVLKGNNCGYFS